MKKVSLAFSTFILGATPVYAADLGEVAARIFADACLHEAVLALGNGSPIEDGAGAAFLAGNVFAEYDRRGVAIKELWGTPEYTITSDQKDGHFFCYVASADLKIDDLTPFFGWLSSQASLGKPVTKRGPAAIDGSSIPAEGIRHTFRSPGRELILEAIYWVSDKGPVGMFAMSIDHHIGN